MRAFSEEFAEHLAGGATTLCWCWTIVRTDGATLRFTDHDRELTVAGEEYRPAHGLDGGETVRRLGPQTETAEVLGVLHSAAISEADILLGRYDGARVESWRVNWREPSERALLRVDTIGEITRADGVFRAELRSGQHALNVPKGRVYQHLCDARLGDARCTLDLDDPRYRIETTVTAVADNRTLIVAGLEGFESGWFAFGTALWTGGRRAGIADAVFRHVGEILRFEKPVGDWVEPGDALTLLAGCNRQFGTCREKFDNAVNFRGFPHIPGSDFLMRYPNSEDRLDGGVLVK